MALRNSFKIDVNQLFKFFLFIHWLIIWFLPVNKPIEQFSSIYFLKVAPLFLLLISLLFFRYKIRQSFGTVLLIVLAAFLIISSLYHKSVSLLYNALLMVITINLIENYNLKIDIRFLNLLFYLSLFAGLIAYYLGYNQFHLIPGMSKYLYASDFRVSFFNKVPLCGMFSFLVFLGNFYYNRKGTSRILLLSISSYFILFSFVRTIIIIYFIFIIYHIIRTKLKLKFSRWPFFVIVFVSFIFVINNPKIFYNIQKSLSPNTYYLVFKTEKKNLSYEKVKKNMARSIIWQKHMKLLKENPILGAGLHRHQDEFSDIRSNGTESFITRWLALYGISFLVFIIYLIYRLNNAIIENNDFLFITYIYMFITMLSYGSLFVPYDFLFILSFGILNGIENG